MNHMAASFKEKCVGRRDRCRVLPRKKKCVPNMGGTFATGSARNPGLSFLSEWRAPTTKVARFATIYSFRELRSIFRTMGFVQ